MRGNGRTRPSRSSQIGAGTWTYDSDIFDKLGIAKLPFNEVFNFKDLPAAHKKLG